MNFFQAIILGIVEGVSEFLPISSTGHLILASRILSISQTNFVKSFEIVIQLGAILAVVVIYWQRFLTNRKIWLPILIAFFPTMVFGLIFYKLVRSVFLGNDTVVVASLFLGGIIIIILEKIYKSEKSHINYIEKTPWQKSIILGIGQSLAIVPGVSRSAATIITGLFLGLDRKTATEFSFFLAVPTMIAATALDLTKSSWSFSQNEWALLLVGLTSAFITGLIAVKWLISYVQKNSFTAFGVYRIVLATIFFLLFR